MYKNPSWRYTLAFTLETASLITVDLYVIFDHGHCLMGVFRSAQYCLSSATVI